MVIYFVVPPRLYLTKKPWTINKEARNIELQIEPIIFFSPLPFQLTAFGNYPILPSPEEHHAEFC